jgi:hypothetical protein
MGLAIFLRDVQHHDIKKYMKYMNSLAVCCGSQIVFSSAVHRCDRGGFKLEGQLGRASAWVMTDQGYGAPCGLAGVDAQ